MSDNSKKNAKSRKPKGEAKSKTIHFNRFAEINEDILNLIFKHFDFEPSSPTATQTRKDLLSAAKACKAFTEPALNSLWRVLPSLLPLLLLLPSAEIVNGEFFADNIPSNNWERFGIHARRVRAFYMKPPRAVISPITYLRIRSMCDGPLLPGLKAIYIPDNTSIDLPSVVLVALGAPLNIVELNNSAISTRSFYIPFMTLLSSELGHLTLRARGHENISLEPVYRLTSLQRLEIRLSGTYLYPETLQRLGALVNLSDLTLDVGAFTPVPGTDGRLPTSSPLSSRQSGKLRRLHIIGIPSSITRVLDDINLASLTTLVIDEMVNNNSGGHTESFWRRCFDQISVCHAIEDIEINQSTNQYEQYSLSVSWFFSLLNLKNMRSLVINGSALSGSDDDFRQLAGAFPRMKKLVVPPECYSEGRTLACLFYFAQECPDLREIKIYVSFDIHKNLDALKKLPLPTTPVNHQLEKLYIHSQLGQIQPTHMVQIAQFLDHSFPNLSILETYNSDTTVTETSNWAGVQAIRRVIQTTRIHAFYRGKSELESELANGHGEHR
ncbi:hypothetical protein BYT27DRAFT_6776524 [Phlegmacium glaucopus]|nr:hypothetical protein BYT27DRAFT_6776524 [Phlegmacium glaucopus]